MPKLAFAAAAALSLLCACSHTRTYSTQDGSVSIDTKGKDDAASMHITGKDGTSMDLNTGKPIADYPSDTPLYQGKSIMDIKTEQKHARVVTVQSSDSMDKINDFYKSQMESKGWKTDSTMQMGKMNMVSASKEGRKLVVTVTSDGKLQTISQQLADK